MTKTENILDETKPGTVEVNVSSQDDGQRVRYKYRFSFGNATYGGMRDSPEDAFTQPS